MYYPCLFVKQESVPEPTFCQGHWRGALGQVEEVPEAAHRDVAQVPL